MYQDDDTSTIRCTCRRCCFCADCADRRHATQFVVVAVEADSVVAVIVSGVLTVEAFCVLMVVETVYSLRDINTKISSAITQSYFGFIYDDSAVVNLNT